MEQIEDIFSDVLFTNKDRVMEILQAEGIDDLKTLRAASKNDLRSAGLKIGDIIKIRTLLENQMISGTKKDLNSSLSSTSSVEDIEKLYDKDDKPLEVIKVQDENNGTSYTAQELLQKGFARTKCTQAQTFFRNLLRDCAKEARIWKKAYPLLLIPDAKLHNFFHLVIAAAPQLAQHKAEIRQRLGQALANRRKYENDIKTGKRTSKGKSRKENKKPTCSNNNIERTIVGYLQKTSSVSKQVEENNTEVLQVDEHEEDDVKDQSLKFRFGEDVIVFKEKENKTKLAKATYLGSKNSSAKNDMYSLLQLKSKLMPFGDDEIPLPEETSDGKTTLNELAEKTLFTWRTNKLGPVAKQVKGPPKKKIKNQKTMGSTEKDNEHEDSDIEEVEMSGFLSSSPIKAHDGEKLKVDGWVAVAHDEGFYVGQITSLRDHGKVNVNFLARRKDGQYRWPKQKDSAIISTEYIFCSKLRIQKVGSSFVVVNETSITTSYQEYKKKYM